MKLGWMSLLLPAALLLACAQPPVQGQPPAPEPDKPADAPPAFQAGNPFGFHLLAELARGGRPENVFISPTSVCSALGMTLLGAGGDTREAIARTLGFPGAQSPTPGGAQPWPAERVVAELARAIKTADAPDSGVQVVIANSLWVNQRETLRPEFVSNVEAAYSAKTAALDFGRPESANAINDWVSQQTRGKIARIVDQVTPETILFLVNAVYFKGRWEHVFSPKRTINAPFHLDGGKEKSVPLMEQTGRFAYLAGDGFEAVDLPYVGGRLSMLIFLPVKESSLKTFMQKLTPENWAGWMQKFRPQEVALRVPRFRLEYEAELADPLKALGMAVAFDAGKANFERLVTPAANVAISRVRHKTFIDVNETGTEAAAATAVGIGRTAFIQPTPFVVDRPFFCAIRDKQTGALLFVGAVFEP